MTKVIMVIVVTASVPTFRRAGEGFTDAGTAFPIDYFSAEKLDVLRAERKLSVQEIAIDKVRDGVDISRVAELAPDDASLPEPESEPGKKPAAKASAKKPAATTAEEKANS